MEIFAKMWSQFSPAGQNFVLFTLAGILGALTTIALKRQPLMLPRREGGAVHLGFVGTLIISVVAAHAVDHTFSKALLAAVCGTATLRRLKAEIDKSFENEQEH